MKVAVKKTIKQTSFEPIRNFFGIFAKIMVEISVMIITLTETWVLSINWVFKTTVT